MSSLRQQGCSRLRQKREEFANQIRRIQRKEIISAKRKLMFQQFFNKNVQTSLTSIPFLDLLNLLQPNHQQELQALGQVYNRLSSPNDNTLYMISQVVQSGKCSYLLQNIINRRHLKQTLSIFSVMVSKPNPRHAQILVNKGILQILMEILNIDALTGYVTSIIGNICIQSDDYCEIILLNFKHQQFIDVFNQMYDKLLKNEISQNPSTIFQTILWFLAVIVSTKDSTLDFQTQYDNILYFCRDLLSKRIMVNAAIETVYELALKNPSRVQEILHPVINELIDEQTGQNEHLQSLLYLVIKLSPGKFNYNKLFQLLFISQYKIIKQIVYIIYKLQDSQQLDQLAKNQAWWEKLLIKLDSNSQQFKMTLSIIRYLKIKFPCVWRFIAEYMEDNYSKDNLLEIMIFIRKQLQQASHSITQSSIALIENLNKYKIPRALEEIFNKDKYQYASKAEEIIFLIQSLSKEVKHKYQIDVEI